MRSTLNVGDKGEELINVSVERRCDRPLWVFDHAELVVRDRRFGDAQFVAIPEAGCVDCPPLRVRWYHEPTGYLDFEVRVFRRESRAEC